MPTLKKKRNPADATLRNVRATKRREGVLTASLLQRLDHLDDRVALLEREALHALLQRNVEGGRRGDGHTRKALVAGPR